MRKGNFYYFSQAAVWLKECAEYRQYFSLQTEKSNGAKSDLTPVFCAKKLRSTWTINKATKTIKNLSGHYQRGFSVVK